MMFASAFPARADLRSGTTRGRSSRSSRLVTRRAQRHLARAQQRFPGRLYRCRQPDHRARAERAGSPRSRRPCGICHIAQTTRKV